MSKERIGFCEVLPLNKRIFFCIPALLILILDTETAITGAREGIELCLQTVIPSLFPFMVLTSILTGLRSLVSGPASYFLPGLLGGYPTGALAVAQGVKDEHISRETGRRLLAFCSNAGPAFIFGMGANLFSKTWMCWAVWAIQILSALLVSLVFPVKESFSKASTPPAAVTLIQALSRSVRTMSLICGWIILFRIMLTFLRLWFLWCLPQWLSCLICGILELSNGCLSLTEIKIEAVRFILFSLFLSFGGICVAMQTYAVTDGMDASLYLPGKILQAIFSTMLSAALFSREISILTCLILIFLFSKKRIAFGSKVMYNRANYSRRKAACSFVKKSSPCAPTVRTPRS